MTQFAYKAKKGPTEIVNGVIEAASAEEAVDKLSDAGLLPLNVQEAGQAPPSKSEPASSQAVPAKTKVSAPALFQSVRSQEITLFGRQLASLLKAGVPILRAIWIIAEQSENASFKKVLLHIYDEVKDGAPLSSVLTKYPKLFPAIYIAMVRTGEDSGTLQEALTRVSDYRQKQEEVFSRVRTAMAYPILMGVTGIGTIVFMLTFVVPKLSGLFASMGENLPMPTRILLSVSNVFQNKALLIGLGAALLVLAVLWKTQGAARRAIWSRLSLGLPFVRGFVMKVELARFSRTFELLLKSGISILRAIEVTAPVLDNQVLRKEIAKKHDEIAGGGSLGQSLKESGIFPLFMTNLVSVGEESGKLEEAMGEIANFYEKETDEAVRIMTSLLEPLMILGMGLIVGFIVIAMLLPMFELNMIVR